eukprot:scaffold1850_cov170-Amphora_coffeaeformis.AAC.6
MSTRHVKLVADIERKIDPQSVVVVETAKGGKRRCTPVPVKCHGGWRMNSSWFGGAIMGLLTIGAPEDYAEHAPATRRPVYFCRCNLKAASLNPKLAYLRDPTS